jgi:glycerol-3-phosphate dehydrogenase
VIGAGVVGCATALALARRGASVVLLEAEREPGLAASGTNSGILHTGFDSPPGELETQLILRAAALRDDVLEALGLPLLRCGALMVPASRSQRAAVAALEANARRNGVTAKLHDDGALEVPGESITDPVAYTLALASAAQRHGAELRTSCPIAAIERTAQGLTLRSAGGQRIDCRVTFNCAGLGAAELARSAGDESFDVYPRKGEFLVFDAQLDRILLPVPDPGTKGVLVFPSVDGKLIAGPTAVDQEDRNDWSFRAQARAEIVAKAVTLHPPLEGAEPIHAYAGLRPAGRGSNYVIERSRACPGLVNVAAIRSTGLTASLAIAEYACALAPELELGSEQPLAAGALPDVGRPWWRRRAAP